MTSHASDTPATFSAQEREELLRLRAEVADLRREAAARPPTAPHRVRSARTWGRAVLAVLLIAVACVLAPLSVVSVWARSEVTDTDRYVDTVAPLAHDPAVQDAITTNLTNIVFQYVDVQGIASQALNALAQRDILPPAAASQLPALAVPLANGVRSFTEDRIGQVVASDTFAAAWDQANRSAHEQLVKALTGQGGAVSVQNNAVRVDLAAFLTVVKERLVASGFTLAERIPAVNATFTVFESADVGKIQRAFNVLDTIGYWFPLILVALAAFGIYLAPNHRLAFIGTGLVAALAMAVTAVALQFARARYLGGVPAAVLPPDAAAVLFDTFVRYLREAIRALALTGVIVALGAFLAGPSVTAVALRRLCRDGLATAKGGFGDLGARMTRITGWVAPRARLLRGLAVAVAFAVLLFERYRTPGLVLWLTVGVLAAVAVIEFLAAEPRRRRRAAAEPVAVPAG
jgi:hypothetical protein